MSQPKGVLALRIRNGEPEYVVTFEYPDKDAQDNVYDVINTLLPYYGANSSRANNGQDYIKPFLSDDNGYFTTEQQSTRIGGVIIPKELLEPFMDRFVNLDGWDMSVDVGAQDNLPAGDLLADGFFNKDNPMLDKLPPIGPTFETAPAVEDAGIDAE